MCEISQNRLWPQIYVILENRIRAIPASGNTGVTQFQIFVDVASRPDQFEALM